MTTTNAPLRLAIIIGSTREGRYADVIANWFAARAIERDDLEVDVVDVAAVDLPVHFSRTGSAALSAYAARIERAECFVVVTPEYNGGIPGVLKYFIDMLKFPESFERRPVCFTGVAAGIWGALRPVEQLQAIFGYRNAYIYPERVFLPGIGKLLDTNGRLSDPDLLERLKSQAEGFVGFTERLQGVKLRGGT